MGLGSSMNIEKAELDEIMRESGFRLKQVRYLHTRFTALDKRNNGYLRRQDFEAMQDIKVNPLRDRILEVLINDFGDSEKLSFKQFVMVFATFRRRVGNEEVVRNTRENRIRFLFSIYDRDKDEKINRAELLSILNILVGKNLPEEHIIAIVERTLAELNLIDQDIDYPTFCETLKKIDIDEKMSIKIKS
jgi:serine/threonine-protein phosphatase 2B regulatory subunit